MNICSLENKTAKIQILVLSTSSLGINGRSLMLLKKSSTQSEPSIIFINQVGLPGRYLNVQVVRFFGPIKMITCPK